jgi:putative sigma-54 modulation protein
MRIDLKFRHSEPSEQLTSYVNEHAVKLEKYELKPVRLEFTFTTEKAIERVDVHVRGKDIEFHARAESDNFFTSVDMALDKIARQLSRKKDKIQAHKPTKVG